MDSSITRHQGLLFGHAGLVAVVGLVSGFFLMFSVLGRIELWPLFASETTVPGEVRAWRAAHVGGLMNALLCGLGAMALPFVAAGRARVFVVYGLIVTAWANTAFYLFGVFGRTHGLSGYDVPGLGQGNAFDLFAFLPAALASGVTIACMIVIANGAFRGARQS
jgi:hypothetical protein